MANIPMLLLLKNASTDIAMSSPTSTTILSPSSNEGCGHCISTLKGLWKEWVGRKAWGAGKYKGHNTHIGACRVYMCYWRSCQHDETTKIVHTCCPIRSRRRWIQIRSHCPMTATNSNGRAPTKITHSPDDDNEGNENGMQAQASTAWPGELYTH